MPYTPRKLSEIVRYDWRRHRTTEEQGQRRKRHRSIDPSPLLSVPAASLKPSGATACRCRIGTEQLPILYARPVDCSRSAVWCEWLTPAEKKQQHRVGRLGRISGRHGYKYCKACAALRRRRQARTTEAPLTCQIVWRGRASVAITGEVAKDKKNVEQGSVSG